MPERITWGLIGQPNNPNLSPAYKSNGLVFTSGAVGNNETGEIIPGIIEQTEQAIKNLKAVLEFAGSSLSSVVKVLLFITEEENFSIVNEIYRKHFPHKPARSCVVVQFGNKDIKVEIEAVAEVTSSSKL